MDVRLQIEKRLLGACLLFNCYRSVETILENYRWINLKHKTIWDQMIKMDFADIIKIAKDQNDYNYMVALTQHPLNDITAYRDALYLAECHFRELFVKAIEIKRSKERSTVNGYIYQNIKEIALDSDSDIFTVISGAINYLASKSIDNQWVKDIQKKIDARCGNIAKTGRKKLLEIELKQLTE